MCNTRLMQNYHLTGTAVFDQRNTQNDRNRGNSFLHWSHYFFLKNDFSICLRYLSLSLQSFLIFPIPIKIFSSPPFFFLSCILFHDISVSPLIVVDMLRHTSGIPILSYILSKQRQVNASGQNTVRLAWFLCFIPSRISECIIKRRNDSPFFYKVEPLSQSMHCSAHPNAGPTHTRGPTKRKCQ